MIRRASTSRTARRTPIRDRLVPLAGILKLNSFELGWLTGADMATAEAAECVARNRRWPVVIVTSLPVHGRKELDNALIEDGHLTSHIRVIRHREVPNGTGDLMSALYLGHRISGVRSAENSFRRAVAGVRVVVERSPGHDELPLITCLSEVVGAPPAIGP